MKTLPGKKTAANTITVVGLFLFSIGAFNLPGQIFFALTLSYFIWKSKVIVFQKQELALLLFSASYFIIYTFHFGFAVKSIIIYLWGPWAAFLFGKWFVVSERDAHAFQVLTGTLTFGRGRSPPRPGRRPRPFSSPLPAQRFESACVSSIRVLRPIHISKSRR